MAVAYGWSELTGYLWSDYELFNQRPLSSLVHGHLGDFFQTAVVKLPDYISPDAQCAAYLAWAVPAMAMLGYACFRTPRSAPGGYATSRSATTATSATRAPATA